MLKLDRVMKVKALTACAVALAGTTLATSASLAKPILELAENPEHRSRPEVVTWLNRAETSSDKLALWTRAAKEGNAHVKIVAVEELLKLDDPRAIPVLKELEREKQKPSDEGIYFQSRAALVRESLEAEQYWNENVLAKNASDRLPAARQALTHDNSCLRHTAFVWLKTNDKPEDVVQAVLDGYGKKADYVILEHTTRMLAEKKSEQWVVPYLRKIGDIKLTRLEVELCSAPFEARDVLAEIQAENEWEALTSNAKTPKERKDAALKALTKGKDESLQRRAVDHLITLDDQDLIPVWVQGVLTDDRIPAKLQRLGGAAVPELLRFIDKDFSNCTDDLDRASAVIGLLRKIGDKRAVSVLARLMQAPSPSGPWGGQLRFDSRVALEHLGQEGLDALTGILNNSKDEIVVAEAATGLSITGDQRELEALTARLAREKASAKPSRLIVDEIECAVQSLHDRLSADKGASE